MPCSRSMCSERRSPRRSLHTRRAHGQRRADSPGCQHNPTTSILLGPKICTTPSMWATWAVLESGTISTIGSYQTSTCSTSAAPGMPEPWAHIENTTTCDTTSPNRHARPADEHKRDVWDGIELNHHARSVPWDSWNNIRHNQHTRSVAYEYQCGPARR